MLKQRAFSWYRKTAIRVEPASSVLISESKSCWLVVCRVRYTISTNLSLSGGL